MVKIYIKTDLPDKIYTFIISLDISIMVCWISGSLTNACILFITSVLFSRAPAILNVAENRKTLCVKHYSITQEVYRENMFMLQCGIPILAKTKTKNKRQCCFFETKLGPGWPSGLGS